MKRMGKVVKIDVENQDITILIEANNQTVHYPLATFNYNPMVGDKVEIIQDGNSFIISNYVEDTLEYQQGKKKVHKTVYVLLAIFLGGFGGHKFYSGRIGLGIVYALFVWTFIPAIIGLVEGIIALGKPTDAEGNIYI